MRKAAAALVAVTTLVTVAPGCSLTSTTVEGAGTAASFEAEAGPGSPAVRDGGLAFAVSDVSRAQQVGDLGDPGRSVTARGVFVVFTLAINNVGSAPLTFIDRDQTLIDDAGRAFSPSMAANIYGNPGIRSTTINPGDGLVVRISFDVPTDTVPRDLILRGSSSSAGVPVAVP